MLKKVADEKNNLAPHCINVIYQYINTVVSCCYFLFRPLCTEIDPVTLPENPIARHIMSYQQWNIFIFLGYILIKKIQFFKTKF